MSPKRLGTALKKRQKRGGVLEREFPAYGLQQKGKRGTRNKMSGGRNARRQYGVRVVDVFVDERKRQESFRRKRKQAGCELVSQEKGRGKGVGPYRGLYARAFLFVKKPVAKKLITGERGLPIKTAVQ